MNVIKTPTGVFAVDDAAIVLTQDEFDALSVEQQNNGTYYITDSDGSNIIDIIGNRDINEVGDTVKDAVWNTYNIAMEAEPRSEALTSEDVEHILHNLTQTSSTTSIGDDKTDTVINGNTINIKGYNIVDFIFPMVVNLSAKFNISMDVSIIGNLQKLCNAGNSKTYEINSDNIVVKESGYYAVSANLFFDKISEGDVVTSRVKLNRSSGYILERAHTCIGTYSKDATIEYTDVVYIESGWSVSIDVVNDSYKTATIAKESTITIRRVG